MTFTFKRHAPTGPYRSFSQTYTDIKIKGKHVGTINEGRGFENWTVSFIVKSDEHSCGWRWAKLKGIFKDEAEARTFVNEKFETINTKFELVPQDN